jgi:hypothetical protein
MLKSVEEQIAELKTHFANSQITPGTDGTLFIEISGVTLPAGWNKPSTNLLLLVPPGYPTNRPNGFEADPDLRLANNNMPAGAGQSNHLGRTWLHFCWQPGQPWDNNKDTLWKHVAFAQRRFIDAVQ